MSEILYTYKNLVTIPPLSMIDDIIAVTTCSLNSIYINATIEAKTKAKQLELSQKKSAHMHIGKNEKSCKQLTVNGCAMATSSKQTYLGDVLSSNGKTDMNITERYNKGLGVANQVFSILKEVHFGNYYFEMAVLFRDSMLVNSILCSVEALYGVKKAHVEKLEAVDRILLRKVLNARYATATEAFYLETGLLPIRFIVIARRLLYYWSILQKSESELVRQVYDAQNIQSQRVLQCLKCSHIFLLMHYLFKKSSYYINSELTHMRQRQITEISTYLILPVWHVNNLTIKSIFWDVK